MADGWYPLATGATGQVAAAAAADAASAAPVYASAGAPASAEIRVGENGYVHGVSGMLDQIASAVMRHAGPMLVRDVLPAVQQDEGLQRRVGQAAGTAIAEKYLPWVALGAASLTVLAAVEVMRWRERRSTARG